MRPPNAPEAHPPACSGRVSGPERSARAARMLERGLERGLWLRCPPRVIGSKSMPPLSTTVDRAGDRPDTKLCPPRCDRAGQPYTSFGPAVRKVNALVAAAMPSLEGHFPGRAGRHGRSAVLAVPQLATPAA